MTDYDAAPLGIALVGLTLGMRHATDPDHVIAVTTILSRERGLAAAARIGIVWGLGHTLTVLLVGASIIVFKLTIPNRLGLAMEFAVAIALILLGAGPTAKFVRQTGTRGEPKPASEARFVHTDLHAHDTIQHRHPHFHLDSNDRDEDAAHQDHVPPTELTASLARRGRLLKSFGVGLVHGLAGSAAIALLVLSAIPEPLWATLYLAIFCIGTIIGMGLITVAIATPFMVASQKMAWLHQSFVSGCGILSFGFGLFLAYQIGIVDHLFDALPIWPLH